MAGPLTDSVTIERPCAAGIIPVTGALRLERADQLGHALKAGRLDVRFIPTGGLTADNASACFSRRSVIGAGGSWMVSPAVAGAGDVDEVTRLTAQAIARVAGARAWPI